VRNGFFKGHGLGNDYLVLDPGELDFALTPAAIRRLCDRHAGIGGDGVLALAPSRVAHFGVRIFNPDGSQAEKSGNGLRIFTRYLHATGRTRRRRLTVETRGGVVEIALDPGARGGAQRVTVAMGRASFRPADLPCAIAAPELVHQPIRTGGRVLRFTGVSIGNPHCVVFRPAGRPWTSRDLERLGPRLETHRAFPRRVNVQLAVATGPHALSVRVWERGAGATSASGSSACAAACAAIRLGLAASPVTVRMPGGSLRVEVSADWDVTLSGPVAEVARGELSADFVRELRALTPARPASRAGAPRRAPGSARRRPRPGARGRGSRRRRRAGRRR
jgi:diaminopimelate epimerase